MSEKRDATCSATELRVVLAGGGTGGHLYPALAIAEALKSQCDRLRAVFLGTVRGVEARVVPEAGYELVMLPVRGFLRKMSVQNILFPFRLAASIWQCLRLYSRLRPHLVIGTGGYVAAPAIVAAMLRGIPFVIQEQNSLPGAVNRFFGRFARRVFITYEDSRRYFRRRDNLILSGNPVRAHLAHTDRHAAYQQFGFVPERKTILIFGGSQGARRLNEIVAESLMAMLAHANWQVLWIVGPRWYEEYKGYGPAGDGRVRVVPYLSDMSSAYAVADVAICRAGATTIAELTLCGIPAIYVPFPFATADHQTRNAESVVRAGGGLLIHERELTPEVLLRSLENVLGNEDLLNTMRTAARSMARPDAATRIARACLDLIVETGRISKEKALP